MGCEGSTGHIAEETVASQENNNEKEVQHCGPDAETGPTSPKWCLQVQSETILT